MSETTLVLPGEESQTAEGDGIEKVGIEVPLGETATLTQTGEGLPEGETITQLPEGAAMIADAEPKFSGPEPELEPDETGAAPAFDSRSYRLEIPVVDGVDAEGIVISFGGSVELSMKVSGSVELSMKVSEHLAFFNALTLGKEVELRLYGVVADKSSPLKVDKEGGKTMIRKAKIKVEGVHLLSPEEL